MALTRKYLKAMGIEDEKIEQIIDAHTETVNGLKDDIAKYKGDAEKLPAVQKELDALKAKGDDGWKDKHDAVKKEFDDYRAEITEKETRVAKEKAVKAYFEGKHIEGVNLNIAMRSVSAEIDALELDGEKIKDSTALDTLIKGDLAGLVSKPGVRLEMGKGLNNEGGKPITKEDIMKIKDGTARRKAMAENPELFGLTPSK